MIEQLLASIPRHRLVRVAAQLIRALAKHHDVEDPLVVRGLDILAAWPSDVDGESWDCAWQGDPFLIECVEEFDGSPSTQEPPRFRHVAVEIRQLVYPIVQMGMEPWFTVFSPRVERTMREDLSHVALRALESLSPEAFQAIVERWSRESRDPHPGW